MIRIIPRLDIKGPNLVKGVHLEGLRVLGNPSDFASYYYETGADEIMFMDVVASLYERNSLHEIIESTAKEIFIPITVGGGIRTIDDIKNVLRCGADKVCINTAAVKNPNFIKEASKIFGSSTIVIAIEAIKQESGKFLAYTDNGREYTGLEVVDWAKKVTDLGAGEIVLTSVDNEGLGCGFNIDLIQKVSDEINIPLVAHGGAGKVSHLVDLFSETDSSAACISSLFHYDFVKNSNSVFKKNKEEGNSKFISEKRNFHVFDSCNISELKNGLTDKKIKCRI